jgi:hypothetical protein
MTRLSKNPKKPLPVNVIEDGVSQTEPIELCWLRSCCDCHLHHITDRKINKRSLAAFKKWLTKYVSSQDADTVTQRFIATVKLDVTDEREEACTIFERKKHGKEL